jgi:hypothetical protein
VPRVWLTLKNKSPGDLLFALVVSFTPIPYPVNWHNVKCETTNPKVMVDDFGISPDAMLYVCAKTYSHSNYKNTLANSKTSKNQWAKANLSGLAAYPEAVADNALSVDLYGNRFRGRDIWYSFLIKREGDLLTDPNYAKKVKDWTHAAGLALSNVLENKSALFVLPTSYIETAPKATEKKESKDDLAEREIPKPGPADVSASATEKSRMNRERQQLEKDKLAFEQQKLAARRENDQKVAREQAERAAQAKTLCLQTYNVALSESALRLFMETFPNDECGKHSQATKRISVFEENRRKATKMQSERAAQTKALVGLAVTYRQTYSFCVPSSDSSSCQSVAYLFEVKGTIKNIDLKRQEIQVQVVDAETTGIGDGAPAQLAAQGQAAAREAFRSREIGTLQWKTKNDLGLVF